MDRCLGLRRRRAPAGRPVQYDGTGPRGTRISIHLTWLDAATFTQAAATIKTNLDIAVTTPIAGGFPAVKAAIESTYACLGITCADVGAYSDTTACIDSNNDADPDADAASIGIVVGLCVAGAVVLVGATAMFAWFRKNGGDGKSERAAANPSPSFTAVAMPAAPPRPRDARRAPPKPPRTDLMAPQTPREDS